MKRIGKTIVAVLMTVLVLSGCAMKMDYGFVIGADKNVKYAYTLAYDKKFIEGMKSMGGSSDSEELTDDQIWAIVDEEFKDLPEGAEKKRYDQEGMYGYVVIMDLGKIDEVSSESASERFNLSNSNDSSSTGLDQLKGKTLFIKTGNNKYKSNMTYVTSSENKQSFESAKQMGATFEVSFSITLPTKPASNNATKVSEDGKTLVWDLTQDISDIDFEFSFNGNATSFDKNIIIYIGIGAVVVVGIILLVVLLGGKKAASSVQVQPVNPVTPVVPTTTEQPTDSSNTDNQ